MVVCKPEHLGMLQLSRVLLRGAVAAQVCMDPVPRPIPLLDHAVNPLKFVIFAFK
jgi:hypothetical protein